MKINRISNQRGAIGTSFHGQTFEASTKQIIKAIGNPDYRDGSKEKTTREWELELEDGTPFTIYDWKEYRYFGDYEVIEWHIGARNSEDADKALSAIKSAI